MDDKIKDIILYDKVILHTKKVLVRVHTPLRKDLGFIVWNGDKSRYIFEAFSNVEIYDYEYKDIAKVERELNTMKDNGVEYVKRSL